MANTDNKNLTLTIVVFELMVLKQVEELQENLTLTIVVFEFQRA